MKVFKFYSGNLYYAYSGKDESEALKALLDEQGMMSIDKVEEIPESEWDEPMISIWEDNDFSKKPFKVSINDQMFGDESILLFTNDMSAF